MLYKVYASNNEDTGAYSLRAYMLPRRISCGSEASVAPPKHQKVPLHSPYSVPTPFTLRSNNKKHRVASTCALRVRGLTVYPLSL